MVELLDIHFNFLCRKQRINKKGQSPIVLRIIYRQEQRDLFMGLYCDDKEWDPDAGIVKLRSKPAETINKNLERITRRAVHVLDLWKKNSRSGTMRSSGLMTNSWSSTFNI
jgi:hypothetical protein